MSMNKPEQRPESDLDIEILVNSVLAAKNAVNAAEAALRNYLRKRAGVSTGGAPERKVPTTFMARATKMVHTEPTDTPEEIDNAGQDASDGRRDGGGDGQRRQQSVGSQDEAGGDGAVSEVPARSPVQQG